MYVLSVLQKKRENVETVFLQVFKKAQNTAIKLDVDIIKPRTAKRSMYRANHYLSATSPEVFYRKLLELIYIPIIDSVLNDLWNCFSENV